MALPTNIGQVHPILRPAPLALPTGAPAYTLKSTADQTDIDVYTDAAGHLIGARNTNKWGDSTGVAFSPFPAHSNLLLELVGKEQCNITYEIEEFDFSFIVTATNGTATIKVTPKGPIYVPKIIVDPTVTIGGKTIATSPGQLTDFPGLQKYILYYIREVFHVLPMFGIYDKLIDEYRQQYGDLSLDVNTVVKTPTGYMNMIKPLDVAQVGGAIGRGVAWGLGGVGTAVAGAAALTPPGEVVVVTAGLVFTAFGFGYSASLWSDAVTLFEQNWDYLVNYEPVQVGPGPNGDNPDAGASTTDDNTDGGPDTNPKGTQKDGSSGGNSGSSGKK